MKMKIENIVDVIFIVEYAKSHLDNSTPTNGPCPHLTFCLWSIPTLTRKSENGSTPNPQAALRGYRL